MELIQCDKCKNQFKRTRDTKQYMWDRGIWLTIGKLELCLKCNRRFTLFVEKWLKHQPMSVVQDIRPAKPEKVKTSDGFTFH